MTSAPTQHRRRAQRFFELALGCANRLHELIATQTCSRDFPAVEPSAVASPSSRSSPCSFARKACGTSKSSAYTPGAPARRAAAAALSLLPFERFHRRAASSILLGLAARVFERRAGVGLDELACLDPLETMPLEKLSVRCLQQRAGNSPRPEVDLPSPLFADRVLDRDVGDLEPSARYEHPVELLEDSVLVRNEVDDTI